MTPFLPLTRNVGRRQFLFQSGLGFFGSAMGYLLAQEARDAHTEVTPASRAKSVIFLMMCGGVSHIDTFDPKDNKLAGKMIEATGFGDNMAKMLRPVIPC